MYSPSVANLTERQPMCQLPPVDYPVTCMEDLRTYSHTTFRGTQDDSSDYMKDKFPLLVHRTPIREGLREIRESIAPGWSGCRLPKISKSHEI